MAHKSIIWSVAFVLLLGGIASAITAGEVEAEVEADLGSGGTTYLDFTNSSTGDTREGLTISQSASGDNWGFPDTSNTAMMVNANSLDDKFNTASDFEITITGLAANTGYSVYYCVKGRPGSPSIGDFSWGYDSDGAAIHDITTISDQVGAVQLAGDNGDYMYAVPLAGAFTSDGTGTLQMWVGCATLYNTIDNENSRTQIDGMVIVPPSEYAWNPSPADNASGVATDSNLSWSSGASAISHDVYFGTSEAAVASAQRLAGDVNGDGTVNTDDLVKLAEQWLTDPGAVNPSADIAYSGKVDFEDFASLAADWGLSAASEFKGNQTGTTFDSGTLLSDTNYYWRIDEVNVSQPDSPWIGTVWSFSTSVATGRQTLYESTTGRRYILYVPTDYNPANSYPLVVSSHGTGQNGDTEMDSTGPNNTWDYGTPTWPELVDAGNDVIVACPDMAGAYGSDGCLITPEHEAELGTDDTAIMAIIAEIEGTYNIDTHNIMLTGFSGGGNVVHYVGLRHPDVFKGICARHGNFHPDLAPSPLSSGVLDMPVFVFTRELDFVCGTTEAVTWYANTGFNNFESETYPSNPDYVNWYDDHVTDRHYALEWFMGLSTTDITIDGHWIDFRGEKVLLIGDSVTQGWMECGSNFDYQAYVDALASRNINVLMLWSFIATSDSRQLTDSRIGYNAPEYWPWVKNGSTFDLNSFNTTYFNELENLVSYANSKDIVILITIHDGWTKDLFANHPFNSANGGPLSDKYQYVDFYDYNNEMSSPGTDYRQKNQYYQEQFVNQLVTTAGSYPNVMFEICNEGEWYNQTNYRAYNVHLLDYIKARTDCPTLVNDDHIGGANFLGEPNCDIIDLHKPNWDASSSAITFFNAFTTAYSGTPATPQFFGEPVPEWQGQSTMIDAAMRMMWGTVLAAGDFVLQNDASFGFDPYANMASEAYDWGVMVDRIGYCATFMNNSVSSLGVMIPNGSLASTGICLANVGTEYVVYSQSGTSFTVNLSAASGQTLNCRFYNPRTGVFNTTFQRTGGSTAESFTKPDSSDWVLHITN